MACILYIEIYKELPIMYRFAGENEFRKILSNQVTQDCFPKRDSRSLSDIFFRGIGGLLITGRVISVCGDYENDIRYYLGKNTDSDEGNLILFLKSVHASIACMEIKRISEKKEIQNVQVFFSDNRIEIYDFMDAYSCNAIRHIDGIGFWEVILSLEEATLFLNKLNECVQSIDKSFNGCPGWLYRRVIEKTDSRKLYDWAKRLTYLKENLTYNEQIAIPNAIFPKQYYDAYYLFRDIEESYITDISEHKSRYKNNYNLSANDVMARLATTAGLVGCIMGRIHEETHRKVYWIDYACGGGQIVNMVQPELFSCMDYEIVGVDVNETAIRFAESYALLSGGKRIFRKIDAGESVDVRKYDLISISEFLEHCYDPLRFLEDLNIRNGAYILAETPLDQRMSVSLPNEHIWTWRECDFTRLFEVAGYKVIGVNKQLFSDGIGALDYITVVAQRVY